MTSITGLAVAEAVMDDKDYEIVNGVKEVKMAGALHGRTIMRLGARLQTYVEQNQLGDMYSPDTTFLIGTNERLPDLAFVTKERIPTEGVPFGKWEIPPDLAVEVISPNDLYTNVKIKLSDYFSAGVREVWIVEPETKLVTIYQSLTRDRILTEDEQLTSDLLPGFNCRVGDLF